MIMKKMLFNYLHELSIKTTTHEHQPVFTVQEATAIFGVDTPYGRCKNLFLKDSKKRFWLISAPFDASIKLKALAKHLNAPDLRFADADLLKHYLGVTPGSVSPFGLINDHEHNVNVILDAALFNHETLGFHPLSNDATTQISPTDLQKFIQACGNNLTIVDLSAIGLFA